MSGRHWAHTVAYGGMAPQSGQKTLKRPENRQQSHRELLSYQGPAIPDERRFMIDSAVGGAVVLRFRNATGGAKRMAKDTAHRAVQQWFVVPNAMRNGDPAPCAEIYSDTDDVTYLSAEGSNRIGWAETWRNWQTQGEKSSGGTVRGTQTHVVVSGPMAMPTHLIRGEVRQQGGQIAKMAIREISAFHREDGARRMIGRHADGLRYWEETFCA